MKIRTLEQLSDKLAEELAWRKKELSALKALIDLKSSSPGKQKALIRSGITMLYAHWEGFIKVAANSYLEFVAMQSLPYNKLSNNFIALAMKDKLEQARETNKATIYSEIADFFMSKLSERSIIKYENRITTSNLSSSVFKEIVCMLGLTYSFYESKEILIDEKLLKKRNMIAHGNHLDIDERQYDELHTQVVAIMDNFRNQIDNCASTKQYCCRDASIKLP
ncbi:MAE_28990/MAE_18760 family HEPN-like nuclease [Pelatocladus sp. BLCC-F211]|uniref:MAE_28990/MAE_18760 family HEPN-like nuclease n=1 Tax=Pelatocladus sp. BLCC-F211 TaxID=3342752 RepID=UPI0035B820F7